MSTITDQSIELRLTRLVKAPRERVFTAWVNPDDLLKWFGPRECTILSARVHPRGGGEYHFRFKTEKQRIDGTWQIALEGKS